MTTKKLNSNVKNSLRTTVIILVILQFAILSFAITNDNGVDHTNTVSNINGQSANTESGHVYYVSKNGNDNNPGTTDRPFKTIQKAANVAIAGDTVYVRQGTYNEKVNIRNSGSNGMYITFAPYPGNNVTIDGTGVVMNYWEGLFQIYKKNYIKISGFRIVNSRQAGIHVDNSNYIVIEKNYIYNSALSAIKTGWSYTTNIIIDNNTIDRPYKSTWSPQETISVSNTDMVEVKNNRIIQNGKGECIDLKDGTKRGKVYKNKIERCSGPGIYLDAFAGKEYDISVYQNVVRGTPWGIMLGVEKGGTLSGVRVYNNIVTDNSGAGIVISSYSIPNYSPKIRNVSIINNIVYNNGRGILVQKDRGYNMRVSDVIIKNNIATNNRNGQILIETGYPYVQNLIIERNIKYGTRGYFEKDGNHVIITDPQFVNAQIKDFRPKSTSPSIDKGFPGAPSIDFRDVRRPQGMAYDIGAYEYIR